MMTFHEDSRRFLMEMTAGDFKACKAVILKERSVLGNHYHRHKDERFLLVQGFAFSVVIGPDEWMLIEAPFEWFVPRGVYHRFDLEANSILVGVATREYDPVDENAK